MNWAEETTPCDDHKKNEKGNVLYFGFKGYETIVFPSTLIHRGKAMLLLNPEDYDDFTKQNKSKTETP